MPNPPVAADLPAHDLLALLRAAAAGDPRAQRELYDRYWRDLERTVLPRAYRSISSDTVDLAQLLWIRLFEDDGRRLLRYEVRPGSKFVSYLRVVLRGLARDIWRREQRLVVTDPCALEIIVSPGCPTDAQLLADELVSLIWEELTPAEKEVWNLWVAERLEQDSEIGRRIGKTANNVYQIRHRIREKLRARFLQEDS